MKLKDLIPKLQALNPVSSERERPTEEVKEKLAKLSAEAAKYLMEHGNEEQRHRAAKFVLDAQR